MDVVQFQEKLREICDLGKQNGNLLTHEQIREHFASTDLEKGKKMQPRRRKQPGRQKLSPMEPRHLLPRRKKLI